LVSLIGHLIPCSARIAADRPPHRDKYCNPHCTCTLKTQQQVHTFLMMAT
jgi:hypothetical protein